MQTLSYYRLWDKVKLIPYSGYNLRGPNFCEFYEESRASKFYTDISTNNNRLFYVAVTQFANLIIANIASRWEI